MGFFQRGFCNLASGGVGKEGWGGVGEALGLGRGWGGVGRGWGGVGEGLAFYTSKTSFDKKR